MIIGYLDPWGHVGDHSLRSWTFQRSEEALHAVLSKVGRSTTLMPGADTLALWERLGLKMAAIGASLWMPKPLTIWYLPRWAESCCTSLPTWCALLSWTLAETRQ